MKFAVILLPQAEQDVDEILAWLNERSPQGAVTWFRRFHEVVDLLAERADASGVAPENEDHEAEIRHILFKTRKGRTYRAIFTIRDDEVFVFHVRGPGQNLLSGVDFELPPQV